MKTKALTNRRRKKRYQPSGEIRIIDNVRNLALGQLVNLHQEGLLIIGEALTLNTTYHITLLLPHNIDHQTEFELSVKCLWSQQAIPEKEAYWSGCSIIDPSPKAQSCIQTIISTQS